mmetsp:Transcript_92971/g.258979  ORF Transcript_92971/g.258979 Transcript_92971/m.258979 type:complete len:224 (-) Transcript_92971:1041-1712(-)
MLCGRDCGVKGFASRPRAHICSAAGASPHALAPSASALWLVCHPQLHLQDGFLILVTVYIRGGTLHLHLDGVPGLPLIQEPEEVVGGGDALPIDGHHYIPQPSTSHWPHSGRLCWPPWHHLHNHDAAELQLLRHHVRREDNAQEGPPHEALSDHALNILRDKVYRDGEANPGKSATATQDGRVHADDLAIAVQQGAAAIARVDRGVCLDDATDWPAAGALHSP